MPLPTALGDSCLTANGATMPMLFVSPSQVNAQLPYEATGNVTLVLHTPGGVSDNYLLQLLPTAPSIFMSGVAGPLSNLPAVLRSGNGELATLANPIHRNDKIVVYLTGMGTTFPAVASGAPAPLDPLAAAAVLPVVTLGGVGLPVEYAGLTAGLVGVYQINARVPSNVPTGMAVPLTISQGGYSTTVALRVIQ